MKAKNTEHHTSVRESKIPDKAPHISLPRLEDVVEPAHIGVLERYFSGVECSEDHTPSERVAWVRDQVTVHLDPNHEIWDAVSKASSGFLREKEAMEAILQWIETCPQMCEAYASALISKYATCRAAEAWYRDEVIRIHSEWGHIPKIQEALTKSAQRERLRRGGAK